MSLNSCPFCDADVDEQLALYGGRCSKCFGDIPGEEAATDPGETVKRRQAVSDARRARFRAFLPVVFALPVLGALVAFSVFQVVKTEPELEKMDFDQLEFSGPSMDLLLVAAPEVKEEVAPKQKTERSHRSRSKQKIRVGGLSRPSNPEEKDALAALGSDTYDSEKEGRVRKSSTTDAMPDFLSSSTGGSMATDMDLSGTTAAPARITVARSRLSDRRDIQIMVLQVLQSQLPRLRSCYESRLRADPNLAGKWTLAFTVNSDGGVDDARATGQSMRDEALEQCVVKKIGRWQFQPIRGTLPVQKTVTFDRR